jgi:hypothetical protein
MHPWEAFAAATASYLTAWVITLSVVWVARSIRRT